ncbi:MAG TPA: cytochrome c biogenesis protein CcdA [Candidatus Merdenecus merdavium]|nr:cytochrome c biogenesis protein CcdA [Candidatus Merdenecus merdavium]
MEYIVSLFEGVITFISPCLLPMLPIYISYFAGGKESDHHRKKTLINAFGFVLGFTTVFIILGAFAGTVGKILQDYKKIVNIVSGLVVIFFGMNFLGIFNVQLFKGFRGKNMENKELGFISSYTFGAVFSVGWTPCLGTFLGSALMLASMQGSTFKGVGMLLCYSIGLGIPFILSAIFIDQLKSTFQTIKNHYKVINTVSGCLLIIIGISMMIGAMDVLLGMLSI